MHFGPGWALPGRSNTVTFPEGMTQASVEGGEESEGKMEKWTVSQLSAGRNKDGKHIICIFQLLLVPTQDISFSCFTNWKHPTKLMSFLPYLRNANVCLMDDLTGTSAFMAYYRC